MTRQTFKRWRVDLPHGKGTLRMTETAHTETAAITASLRYARACGFHPIESLAAAKRIPMRGMA